MVPRSEYRLAIDDLFDIVKDKKSEEDILENQRKEIQAAMRADISYLKNTYMTREEIKKELKYYTTIPMLNQMERHLQNFPTKSELMKKLELRDNRINEV